jgi:hypothetical protein
MASDDSLGKIANAIQHKCEMKSERSDRFFAINILGGYRRRVVCDVAGDYMHVLHLRKSGKRDQRMYYTLQYFHYFR